MSRIFSPSLAVSTALSRARRVYTGQTPFAAVGRNLPACRSKQTVPDQTQQTAAAAAAARRRRRLAPNDFRSGD